MLQKQIDKILNESKLPKFNIDDYTLYKQIGEGSYGVIYQAFNNNDKKKYALKKIIAHDIEELEGFEEEFELVYICDHQNVMKIYGICVNILDSTTFALYVLMELALGDWNDEIKKHLNVRKNYKEDDLINILKQLINALLFMQTKMKIAHRDIKPQNILIFKNKIYKVADFGEAKEAKIAKQLNTLRGTELYMSPVLYDGLKKDKDDVTHNPYKSDVFSLGFCLMYAASLNFNIIYEVRDVTDTNRIDKILHKHFKNKYTEKFIQVLLSMLEIDESKRYDFVELNDYINKIYP
jgi:serine/threonine protein kinase